MSWIDELLEHCGRELVELKGTDLAGPTGHLPVGMLDALWGYRLLLGRWPEFRSLEEYRRRLGMLTLEQFVESFLGSAEFKARHSGFGAMDLAVMRRMPQGFALHFNLNDRQAVRIASGEHEPEIQQAIGQVVRPGMTCIDAGAHIGLYTLLMGLAVKEGGGKVWSFEPFPQNLELLRENVRENGLEETVTITAAACHAEAGTGRLYMPDRSDFGPSWVQPESDGREDFALAVPLVRIDDVLPPAVKVDVVKMDIEGSEPFALRGMQRILRDSRPTLFLEFLPKAFGVDPSDYLNWLRGQGYRLQEVADFLAGNGRWYDYCPGGPTTNLVGLPA